MAGAPAAPAPGERCKAAEYHQFDFWIGSWEVFDPTGKQRVGRSSIEPVLRDCAIAEHWSGTQAGEGKSYNAYDPNMRRWHQFWVAETGNSLWLTGAREGAAMVMEGEQPAANGSTTRQRITWTPAADGTVRQLWESSNDGGKTWNTAFDGRYRRVPAP